VFVVATPLAVYALVRYGTEGLVEMLLGTAAIGVVFGLFFVVVTWFEIAMGWEAVDSDLRKRPQNRDGS